VIVRLVDSHLVDPDTNGFVLENTTSHETSFVASTVTELLVVDLVTGDVAPLSVNVSAALSTVPVQVRPSCSVNDSVPLIGAPCAEVIVAESFGSHVCCDVADVVSLTVKHSVLALSLDAL
jgi:hypothetical protein